MNLNSLGLNQTELHLNDMLILFSYKTPVAAYILGEGVFKTEKNWSKTTTKHINKWLADLSYPIIEEKPQSFFDGLVK